MKTLIVVGNPTDRQLLETQVRFYGNEVTVCANAETALEAYRQSFYPLIVVDVELPDMDGLELCRRLRALPQKDQSMILLISECDELKAFQAALNAGVDDYLIKPLKMPLLNMRLAISERRFRNLSKHRRVEEALRNSLVTLEQLEEEKALFIRILTHELKAPVTAAKMMVDLLVSYPPENPRIAHLPERISARMEQLLALIKDMLEVARVQSRDLLDNIAVLDFVVETQKACKPYINQAEDKGLAISIECHEQSLFGRFDSQRYALILSNLVSNAIKYTAAGFVKITLKRQDSWIVLEVADSGIGIPESDLPRIFKEFFRASNAKRLKIQGTGVGLAGIKHIVERFGGKLELQSRENEGSTFTVRLPLHVDAQDL